MPSRRQVLSVLGAATTAGLAGCSGSDSGGSATRDCQSGALARGEGTSSTAVRWRPPRRRFDGDGRGRRRAIRRPLNVDDVREQNVDALELYDAAGELAHVIAVSPRDADVMANKGGVSEGRLRYEQCLGERPLHDRYRVVAVDDSDETVDSITIEFNCFPDVSNDV